MANEFKVKNALKVLNSTSVSGIYDTSSAFNGDSSTNESLGTINATQKYVESFAYNRSFIDGSLSLRDTSLGNLSHWNVTQDSSIVNLRSYVDGSLATIDTSLGNLSYWNVTQDASLILKASLTYVDGSLATRDTSLGNLSHWEIVQDASLVLKASLVYVDGSLATRDTSLGNLSHWNVTQDSSITNLRSYIDGSLSTRDTSLGNLSHWEIAQDASLILKASLTYVDGSLATRDTSITWLFNNKVNQTLFDASILSLKNYDDQRWIDINRCGFVNEADVSISFNDSTYVLTLHKTGATWTYIRAGLENTISTDVSVQIGNPPTKGTYYVVINNTTGQLTSSNTIWTLTDATLPVAAILWDASLSPKFQLANEKHQSLIDRRNHLYLHTTRGTQYVNGGILSGPTVGGTTNLTNVFGVTETVIADEDLFLTLPSLTTPDGSTQAYTLFFRTNASTWAWEDCSVPYRYGATNLIQWDSSGTMTNAANVNSNYYNWYLLYSDIYGKARYGLFPGRGIYGNLVTAQAEDPKTFDFTGFPIAESVIAYQFTWESRSGQTNLGKVRLAATPKKINVSTVTSVGSSGSIDHNALSGLFGSADYYHLSTDQYNDLVGKAYTDGSLATRDTSLGNLSRWEVAQDASLVLKASLTYVDGSLATRDTSLGNLSNWNVTQDSSITNLRTYIDGSLSVRDTSLGNLSHWEVDQDASIVLKASFVYVDGSLATRDTSLGNLSRWEIAQDSSIVNLRTYVDGSLSAFIRSASTGLTLYWANGLVDVSNYVSKQYVDGSLSAVSVVINDNILDWNDSSKWYAPYSSKQSGLNFYTGTSDPDGTSRLNLNGYFYSTSYTANNLSGTSYTTNNTNGTSYYSYITTSGTAFHNKLVGSGTGLKINCESLINHKTGNYIELTNTSNSSYNISGNYISIIDDPSTIGTISGKILTATIGNIERFKIDPRVLDTSSAVAYVMDTLTSLTQTGAKLVSVKNSGSEKFYVDKDGNTNIPSGATYKIGEIGMYTNAQVDAAINAALVGQQTFSAIYAFNNFI